MNIRNLSTLAYAQGFTLWHYKLGGDEGDTPMSDSSFFGDASDMVAPGDVILVTGPGVGTQVVVGEVREGHVEVRPMFRTMGFLV